MGDRYCRRHVVDVHHFHRAVSAKGRHHAVALRRCVEVYRRVMASGQQMIFHPAADVMNAMGHHRANAILMRDPDDDLISGLMKILNAAFSRARLIFHSLYLCVPFPMAHHFGRAAREFFRPSHCDRLMM